MTDQPDEQPTTPAERLAAHLAAELDAYERATAADRAHAARAYAARTRTAPLADRLDDAGRIRRAARAIDTDALIIEARTADMPAAEIARRLDVTEGYARRVWREHRKQQAAGPLAGGVTAAEFAAGASRLAEAGTSGRAWARDYARRHNSGTRTTRAAEQDNHPDDQ